MATTYGPPFLGASQREEFVGLLQNKSVRMK